MCTFAYTVSSTLVVVLFHCFAFKHYTLNYPLQVAVSLMSFDHPRRARHSQKPRLNNNSSLPDMSVDRNFITNLLACLLYLSALSHSEIRQKIDLAWVAASAPLMRVVSHTHTHTRTHARTPAQSRTHTLAHTKTHARTHTHTYSYTHTHTHERTS